MATLSALEGEVLDIALFQAIKRDDTARAQRLIIANANVNAKEPRHGGTPLRSAAVNGNEAMTTLLIRANADLEATVAGGFTALHEAAACGQAGTTTLLLQAGANPNARDNRGCTALHEPTRSAGYVPTVNALLDGGVDPTARDNRGKTPLDYATLDRCDEIIAILGPLTPAEPPRDGALTRIVHTVSAIATWAITWRS